MAAAILLIPLTADPGLLRIAGAIIRHAGRGSCRRNGCDYRGLDDNLRRRRRSYIIGGSAFAFLGGGVFGGATTDNEQRGRETQDSDRGDFVFHLTNLTYRE